MSKAIESVLSFCLICFFQFSFGQDLAYNRLMKLEQNHPNKVEKVALRYKKFLSKNPTGYFFLAKNEYKKFEFAEDDKSKLDYIYKCLILANKVQVMDVKGGILDRNDWKLFKEKVKYEAFFFLEKLSVGSKKNKCKVKYYKFVSNNKRDNLLDSELELKVPENQRVDSLFYGLPTGNEYVPRKFEKEEMKMLKLINDERIKMNLVPMKLDSTLSVACRYHAFDMGSQDYISHIGHDLGMDGRRYFANYTFDRIRQFYKKSRVLGENISWGRFSSFHTFKGWYESKVHNEIMFNPKNGLVGIGLVHIPGSDKKYYWVLCTAE